MKLRIIIHYYARGDLGRVDFFPPGGVQVYTILMYQKEKIERAKRSSKFGSVLGNLDLKTGYLDQVSPPKPEITGSG